MRELRVPIAGEKSSEYETIVVVVAVEACEHTSKQDSR